MSKTVTGYIEIPGLSYSEIIQEVKLVQEVFELTGLDVEVYYGKTLFFDGKEVTGLVIKKKGGRIYDQVVVTEKEIVYDDMIDRSFLQMVKTTLSDVLPGFVKLEKEMKKLKGKVKNVKRSIVGGEILVEVELA